MKKVLTIAGSDCSGGAGIEADIKTITAHKVYAMSVITALTAQNTTGVYGIMDVPTEFVAKQLDCVFTDIVPDAVKIGMVSNAENIEVIADKLKEYGANNVVVDPVMVSTSGSKLLSDDAIDNLKKYLFPMATLITPNIPELEELCGIKVYNKDDMMQVAKIMADTVCNNVLVKGGHLSDSADDLLFSEGKYYWYESSRVDSNNTHGTGCTLSSAIASNLALGYSLNDSIANAKDYILGALKSGLNLGSGNGPIDHCFNLR